MRGNRGKGAMGYEAVADFVSVNRQKRTERVWQLRRDSAKIWFPETRFLKFTGKGTQEMAIPLDRSASLG